MARKHYTERQKAVIWAMGEKRRDEFVAHIDNVLPCIYASLGIALYEDGWDYDKISDLFAKSQKIWEERCMEEGDMIDQFEQESGIQVRLRVE